MLLPAVFATALFRRITPLLMALQGAAATEPAAAAMLAEWNERRLDACTRYADAALATGQLAASEEECRDVLAATMDGAFWRGSSQRRMDRRALHLLARPPLGLPVGQTGSSTLDRAT